MPHVRAQIREFVRARLTEIPGLEQYVTIDSEEIPEDLQLPIVHVLIGDETIDATTLGGEKGRKQQRLMQMFTDIYCQHKKEPLLKAEEYAALAEPKLLADVRMGGLTTDLRLTGYTISRSDEGKQPIVQLRLSWTVLYFTNEWDATVPA